MQEDQRWLVGTADSSGIQPASIGSPVRQQSHELKLCPAARLSPATHVPGVVAIRPAPGETLGCYIDACRSDAGAARIDSTVAVMTRVTSAVSMRPARVVLRRALQDVVNG